jgi:hypothetical protein
MLPKWNGAAVSRNGLDKTPGFRIRTAQAGTPIAQSWKTHNAGRPTGDRHYRYGGPNFAPG